MTVKIWKWWRTFGVWIIAWRRAAWWAENLHFRLSFKWEITCIMLTSCLYIIMSCVTVISKDGDHHFLILGTHLSFFTSRGRVCLPSSWICISINWFWLIESDRKDAAAQDAGTLTSFTFLFLGTQPPYCEKLMPHEDSTWRRTGVLWLAGPAGLWAITRAIFHPVKELIQSRPQITATLVMIMGSRGTH